MMATEEEVYHDLSLESAHSSPSVAETLGDDLFNYFLNPEDLSSGSEEFSAESPERTPPQLSPESPHLSSEPFSENADFLSVPIVMPTMYGSTPGMIDLSGQQNQNLMKVKEEPKERSSQKKRDHAKVDTPLNLSREELLQLSSKSLENFAQNLAANRGLSNDEERQLKRQRRLIKNRESAQLSRLRKKIYIEELEKKVSLLTADNDTLTKQVVSIATEKKKLEEEVMYLQSIIKQSPQLAALASKRPSYSGPKNVKAAGVCLLIVLFSFGLLFNSSPSSEFQFRTQREEIPEVVPKSTKTGVYTGRA
jgi:hypothetical protein